MINKCFSKEKEIDSAKNSTDEDDIFTDEDAEKDYVTNKDVNERTTTDIEDNSSDKWQDASYFRNSITEYMFILFCMMSQLLSQASTPQTLSIMNILSESFHSDSKNQSWLMASFPLVSGSFILVSGRIGDIYGLKITFVCGYVFFIIWTLICGFTKYSGSDTFFIISRAFQGLGMAFVLPNMMGCVGVIYKPNTFRKNIVIALIGACAPVGATLGALFGGLIGTKDPEQWPWSFYAMAIASTLTLIMALYSTPNTLPTNVHKFSINWYEILLAIAGLVLLNFVWNQGPLVGWNKAYIITLLIISIFLVMCFIVVEIKLIKVPLIPRPVMKDKHLLMILASLFLGWGSFGIFSFYYFSFLLNLRHYSAVWAGGTYFMFGIFGVVASVCVGISIKKVSAAVLLFLSMLAFTVGCIMLSVTPVDQTYFRINLGTMIILSFGMDMSFPAAAIILSDGLPIEFQGMAGSLANTMVNYSMSLCLGMGTTVEKQINNLGNEVLKGYRSAEYLGIGLAGLGSFIMAIYVMEKFWKGRNKNRMLGTNGHEA